VLFDYIYYRIYDVYLKRKDVPNTTSLVYLTVFQFFLLITLLVISRITWDYDMPSNFSKYWALPPMILVGLLNWLRYGAGKKYPAFRERWDNEKKSIRRLKGWLIVIGYIFLLTSPISLYVIFLGVK
jgi:hypothetical protein